MWAPAVVRGLVVGLGVYLVTLAFAAPQFAAPLWIVVFALLGAALLGTLGLIAGLWADKFDQMAAFQNFIIVPMTFLSGVFYSIHSLPPFWQQVSHLNPFFYMIDGFRYGFFGQSDVSPWLSLGIVGMRLAGGQRLGTAAAAHRATKSATKGVRWARLGASLGFSAAIACYDRRRHQKHHQCQPACDYITRGGRWPPLVCRHRFARV